MKIGFTVAAFLFLFQYVIAQEAPFLNWAAGTTNATSSVRVNSMALDAAENIYYCGWFSGTVDFDPGPGVSDVTVSGVDGDMFIMKMNNNGSLGWVKTIGGAKDEEALSMDIDASGNIYVAGQFESTPVDFNPSGVPAPAPLSSAGSRDAFIMKFNATGGFEWVKRIGSSGSDLINTIKVHPGGGFVVAGVFTGTVNFDPSGGPLFTITAPGTGDGFIERFDSDGNVTWLAQLTGSGREEPIALDIDGSGNIYSLGAFQGSADFDPSGDSFPLSTMPGAPDIFLMKLDGGGDFLWAGNIARTVTTGGFASHALALVVDNLGIAYATFDMFGDEDLDPGAGTVTIPTGNSETIVSKFNADGTLAWARELESSSGGANYGHSITLDNSGNILIAVSGGGGDFDPVGVTNSPSPGSPSTFIVKWTPTPTYVWVGVMGTGNGPDSNHKANVVVGPSNHIYVAGRMQGTRDLDPSACVFNVAGTTGSNNSYYAAMLSTMASPPTFLSFTPTSGAVGTPVTLTGTNFSSTLTDNTVTFNLIPAVVSASSPTSITTTVPAGATTGRIRITVQCVTVQRPTNFTVTTGSGPTISGFTPASGPVTTPVTITGTNFSTTPANNTVMFNGTAATVTSSSTTSIVTAVPAGATTGTITVTVAGNTATSATDFTVTTPAPTITGFSPASGPPTTIVTITGTNFSTNSSDITVLFNGTPGVVTSSTTTSIVVEEPDGATTGPISVSVGGHTIFSATNFTVTAPTITIGNQPDDVVACNNADAVFSADAIGASGITYQWQYSATSNGAFNDITDDAMHTNATTPNLRVGTTDQSVAGFYRCKTDAPLASTVYTDAAELTIVPTPQAPETENAEGCAGTAITLTASGGVDDEYRWYSTETGGVAIASQTPGFQTPPLSQTTTYYVTISKGTSCEGPRAPVTATVNICSQELMIYTAVSPNGDGLNDILFIENIDVEANRRNKMTLYNRWGSVVFDITDYDNVGRVFKGESNASKDLPSGVYFFKLEFESGRATETGYIVLKR